ncbi:MAG: ROK family protein [Oscillospiraceae bacterium]|jgi:predicted NBD/HSP70 family sugar kinase|nr:ROK family protein [Oscillospiraceae bacterium]
MNQEYVVIDVGGTSIKYALMDSHAATLDSGMIPTPYAGLKPYLSVLCNIFETYDNSRNIAGIALSVPGIIDSEKGYLYTGGSLNFISNFPLSSVLSEKCGVPVTVENDGKCAALAEAWRGSLKDCQDAIVILLGTGVGGGIIKNGKVHKGKHFSAGEFSFIQMGDQYESMENLWGMQSGNKKLCQMVAAAKNKKAAELDGLKIFELANGGDPVVLKVLGRFTMTIARMIFNLQTIYDPEKIAIGGGISRQNLLIEMIQSNLDYLYQVFPCKIPKAQIVQCHYFNEANRIGALRTFQLHEICNGGHERGKYDVEPQIF